MSLGGGVHNSKGLRTAGTGYAMADAHKCTSHAEHLKYDRYKGDRWLHEVPCRMPDFGPGPKSMGPSPFWPARGYIPVA